MTNQPLNATGVTQKLIDDTKLLKFYDDQSTMLNFSRDAINFVDRAFCVDSENELQTTDASAVLYMVGLHLEEARDELEKFFKGEIESENNC